MKTSIAGMMEIAAHEGIVLSPYKDSVGVWTVFIGHTAAAGDPNPARMAKGVPTSLKLALDTFRRDLVKYERGVEKAFTRPLKQHEFDAAVSFHYNTGSIGRATWVKKFNAGDRHGAIAAIMNWKSPPEIIPRRQKEQKLFAESVYSSGGFANVYPADKNGRVLWSKGSRMNLRKVFKPDVDDTPPVIDSNWDMGGPPPPDVEVPEDKTAPPSGGVFVSFLRRILAFIIAGFRR